MPNRILRDWTDSKTINKLSWQAEVLFTRLIMKADDYGNYFADSTMIKTQLFPRKDGLRTSDIEGWLKELQTKQIPDAAPHIRLYAAKGETFLHIVNFKQRLRTKKRKFPQPPPDVEVETGEIECQTDDGHVTDTRRPEVETNPKQNSKPESEKKVKTPAHENILILEPDEIATRMKEQEYQVKEYIIKTFGFTEKNYPAVVDNFIGEKTTGKNQLDGKDYSEVLAFFKSWVRLHSEKLLRQLKPLNENGDNGNGKNKPDHGKVEVGAID